VYENPEQLRAQRIRSPPLRASRLFGAADVDRARIVVAAITHRSTRRFGRAASMSVSFRPSPQTWAPSRSMGRSSSACRRWRRSAQLPGLLFDELVHVVQYRLLGVDRFAQRYVDGWLAGRVLGVEPMRRLRDHSARSNGVSAAVTIREVAGSGVLPRR